MLLTHFTVSIPADELFSDKDRADLMALLGGVVENEGYTLQLASMTEEKVELKTEPAASQ